MCALQEEEPFIVDPVYVIPRRLRCQHPEAAFLPCGSKQRSRGKPLQCFSSFPICEDILGVWYQYRTVCVTVLTESGE